MAATTLVALTNSPVSAAPGVVSVVRSATSAPASISSATAVRAERLNRSNQMLIIGRDQSTPGSRFHIWKVNDDLSIDNTFGAIDLGANFATGTAADSDCVARNDSYCNNIDAFIINENADRYVVVMGKPIIGTGQYSYDVYFRAVAVGKISTGEVLASVLLLSNSEDPTRIQAGWSNVPYIDPGRSTCTSAIGATVNNAALHTARAEAFSTAIRPDGSLIMSLECIYSNIGSGGMPSSVYEFNAGLLIGLKPDNSTLVVDTSFGTNGHVIIENDTSRCRRFMPNQSHNSGITSMTSTAVFIPYLSTTYDRITTVPSYLANQGVTTYDGCADMNPNSRTNLTTEVIAFTITGAVKNRATLSTGSDFYVPRWSQDPLGNWNAVTFMPPANQQAQPTTALIRLTKEGLPDSTNGTNGVKTLSLPSSVTVNGTAVSMNYSIAGYATTATSHRFIGFAVPFPNYSCTNNQANVDVTRTYYPYYLSADGELDTSYGQSGLAEGFSIEIPRTHLCGTQAAAVRSFINSAGKHVVFAQTIAIGSQSTGLVMATWDPAADVTGGGEAPSVGAASAGRTDSKVYSRRLPTRTEVNTSLNVLTKKMSRTQMLRTRTPKVCVNLSRSVLVVKTGTCRVEIVDKSTKQVVRRLSTRVRSTEQTVGTTVDAQDPIRFKQVSTRLSRTAKSQIAELAEAAAEAKRVILVGHTAALTENTVSNNRIALQRAARVKAELRKQFKAAGVKVPISIVSAGPNAPLTTKRTEAAQARNRRVEIYIMP